MEISNLATALDAAPPPPPREQERLRVDDPPPKPAKAAKPAKKKQGVSDYTVMRAAEAPDYTGDAPGAFLGYARPMGSEQLGVNLRVLAPGTAHVPPGEDPGLGHSHRTIEELYFVVDGEVTVKLGDDVVDARSARRGADPVRDTAGGAQRLGCRGGVPDDLAAGRGHSCRVGPARRLLGVAPANVNCGWVGRPGRRRQRAFRRRNRLGRVRCDDAH